MVDRGSLQVVAIVRWVFFFITFGWMIAGANAADERWTATWAAPATGLANTDIPPAVFHNQTVRMRVHVSIGGSPIRIRVGNIWGSAPLDVAHVTVARALYPKGPRFDPRSLRTVTFLGRRSVRVPTGASYASDPIALSIPAGSDVIVSLYLPAVDVPADWHIDARATTYISRPGDHAADVDPAAFKTTSIVWYFLTELDVVNAGSPGAIVAFGDSITEGAASTLDANHRYPDRLAAAFLHDSQPPYAVVQGAIGGNRILLDGGNVYGQNAIARFDRDALLLAGTRAVILMLGVNDIQEDPNERDPQKIIGGLSQLIDQAHTAGKALALATIGPIGTCGCWTPDRGRVRDIVNTWIRRHAPADDVIDFDRAMRDPRHPENLNPRFDSGDHLHPNDLGYAAMAAAIDRPRLRAAIERVRAVRWTSTWASPEVAAAFDVPRAGFRNQTIRMRVHVSIGGSPLRIRLGNVFGTAPLAVAHVTLARPRSRFGPQIDPATMRNVTFNGGRAVVVPAGASFASDPIGLALPAAADAIVSMYVRVPTGPASWHRDARSTSFISTAGDHSADAGAAAFPKPFTAWFFLTELDVVNTASPGAITVYGDSISEGAYSTIDANHRYPDFLAAAFLHDGEPPYAIAQGAIGGNRILLDSDYSYGQNAIARFGRDALLVADTRAVIVMLGVNDLQFDPSEHQPQALIAGLAQLIDQAHTAGTAIGVSTITPIGHCTCWTPERDRIRGVVNAWIRHDAPADDVLDFDRAVRDPGQPDRIRPGYDSGDHIHPNDRGYAAMAASIDRPALRAAIDRVHT